MSVCELVSEFVTALVTDKLRSLGLSPHIILVLNRRDPGSALIPNSFIVKCMFGSYSPTKVSNR